MNNDKVTQNTVYALPDEIITRADISRLLREVEVLDSELTAIAVRAGVGVATEQSPRLSTNLSAFLTLNRIDLKENQARSGLIKQLRELKDDAAVIHFTFASAADQESLAKLVHWVRGAINPHAVIEIGLQPSLIAGVMVRTENQIHDLSLRNAFRSHADFLVKELENLRVGR